MLRIITDHDPVIIYDFNGVCADNDITEYIKYCDVMLKSNRTHVIINDFRGCTNITPRHRRMIADWQNLRLFSLCQFRAGVIFVLDSAVQRGALKALHWIKPPPTPYYVGSTINDALIWIETQLNISIDTTYIDSP